MNWEKKLGFLCFLLVGISCKRVGSLDNIPPDTFITKYPPPLTNSTTALFEFESNEKDVIFECLLNNEEWMKCFSPKIYADLKEGFHRFEVRAVDKRGNVDSTPGIAFWKIDITPPTISFLTYPKNPTNATEATFVFDIKEGIKAMCQLDLGGWEECISPKEYFWLSEGIHTFRLRGLDEIGNMSEINYSWGVDRTPPILIWTSYPSYLTNATNAIFEFEFVDDEPDLVVKCKLDSQDWKECVSPVKYIDLSEGEHTFYIEAMDRAGNFDYRFRIWRIMRDLIWGYKSGKTGVATPVCEDVNNDGKPEVIVNAEDRVAILKGKDGSILWEYNFYNQISPEHTPSIGDVNGDGKKEVIIGRESSLLVFAGENGSLLWEYHINSSSTIGDVDGDSQMEVIASDGDKVYAFRGENGDILWTYPTGTTMGHNPSLGDVDGDGFLEVIVNSMWNSSVYAINGEDASLLWATPITEVITSSPSLGDIDGDGKLEVIIGDAKGEVFSLNGEDGSLLWKFTAGGSIIFSSAAIGDIDSDGKLEVIIASNDKKVYAINGEDGSLLWQFLTHPSDSALISSPSLGDVNGDGKIEVVIGHPTGRLYIINGENGELLKEYVIEEDIEGGISLCDVNEDGKIEAIVGSYRGTYAITFNSPVPPPELLPWPKFKHDVKNTGLYTGDPYPPW